MANQTIRTPEKRDAILEALRERPIYSSACRKARITRAAFYDWRRSDPIFNADVIAAREEGLDSIEDALITRSIKNDTTAGIFMLKSLRRDVYGDKLTVKLTIEQKAEEIAKRLGVPKETVLDRARQIAAGAWDTWQPE